MKIALCSSFVPFVNGGYRNIVEWLETELKVAGHQVERIYLPQVDAPDLLFTQMMAYRWIDLTESADRVICFRPPAHYIPHPNKVLWFIHHIRVFYDLWDTPYRTFPDDAHHRAIRSALHESDTLALKEAKSIFTNSKVVSDRLHAYNKVDSEVLYPPIAQPEKSHCRGFNDEIAYICRVEHHKRQHLLLEALRYTRTPVKLRIAGKTSNNTYANELRSIIAKFGLESRVVLDDRWISEEEKINILSECLAAAYLPLDEDSYGYPSLEASHSGKPIISTYDSGGVLELVAHNYNGLLTEPDPKALAEAMDKMYLDRAKTQKMGSNAFARVGELNISWAHVVDRLLA